jgi:hypothetical protein
MNVTNKTPFKYTCFPSGIIFFNSHKLTQKLSLWIHIGEMKQIQVFEAKFEKRKIKNN